MANLTVEIFWTRLEPSAAGANIEVEYQVVAEYFLGERGKTWGLPEDCYPPEPPEVDVTDVYEIAPGPKPRVVDLEAFLDSLTSEQFKELEGRLLWKAEEQHRYDAEEDSYELRDGDQRD